MDRALSVELTASVVARHDSPERKGDEGDDESAEAEGGEREAGSRGAPVSIEGTGSSPTLFGHGWSRARFVPRCDLAHGCIVLRAADNVVVPSRDNNRLLSNCQYGTVRGRRRTAA